MNHCHEIRTVRCAHCGRLRQETSHWFVVTAVEGKFLCTPMRNAGERTAVHESLQLKHGLKRRQQPACGHLCAQRLFERYLAEQAIHRTSRLQAGDDQTIAPAGAAKTEDEHAR